MSFIFFNFASTLCCKFWVHVVDLWNPSDCVGMISVSLSLCVCVVKVNNHSKTVFSQQLVLNHLQLHLTELVCQLKYNFCTQKYSKQNFFILKEICFPCSVNVLILHVFHDDLFIHSWQIEWLCGQKTKCSGCVKFSLISYIYILYTETLWLLHTCSTRPLSALLNLLSAAHISKEKKIKDEINEDFWWTDGLPNLTTSSVMSLASNFCESFSHHNCCFSC